MQAKLYNILKPYQPKKFISALNTLSYGIFDNSFRWLARLSKIGAYNKFNLLFAKSNITNTYVLITIKTTILINSKG